MILQRIRDSYVARGMAVYLSISMIFQMTYPTASFALTGGPSQPEVQSFSPVGTTDMVDLTSGDFNYNIPLLDVGGYPINMVYNSGITMDQEASWVGLGWNINPGVINRNMRGLPDDFDGDKVKKTTYMKPSRSIGVDISAGPDEAFGFNIGEVELGLTLNAGMGISYNNYTGVNLSQSLDLGTARDGLNANLGLKSSSNEGLTISPSVSYDKKLTKEQNKHISKRSTSLGVSFNTIGGLSSASLGHTLKNRITEETKGVSGTLSLVPNTYTPQINQARNSLSISFGVKTGGTLFGGDASATIGAMYSSSWLKDNKEEVTYRAYGYLNSEHAGSKAMLDFNREKEAGYNEGTTNLPITNYTYDAYSIQGQGVSGAYRPYRSEVGAVHDNKVYSLSGSANGNIDLGAGGVAALGTDVKYNIINSESGLWTQDNEALSVFNFKGSTNNFDNNAYNLYEPYYYKQSGELAVDHDDIYKQISGDQPVQIPLERHGAWGVKALPELKEKTSNGYVSHYGGNLDLQRKKRVNRNQLISTLTKAEAAVVGVRKYVVPQAEDHHVSEITVTKNDGSRYVYGIPVYNNVQKEVTFSISEREGLPNSNAVTGLVAYNPTTDNKPKNGKGRDEFYSKTELPPYAHSYLISEVLSHDYVDVNGNGADDADYGTYTRFDYTTDLNNYKWRVPYQKNHANFNEGLKAEHQDETASYIYGEKDVRYLKTIETKTHVAVFHTSFNRTDAYEVIGENGSEVPTTSSTERTMKQLDKISLYAKGDWNANYNDDGDYNNLTPIKEVHFEYGGELEELCQDGLPNAQENRGKLTLKKVYFTYGKSYKAKWSPYEFTYNGLDFENPLNNDEQRNPSYNLKGYNVWGGYKKNQEQPAGVALNNPFELAEHGELTNPEFPYVEQSKTIVDLINEKNQEDINSSAWALTAIKLPSGGTITIDYESDDYAYVQNRRAMQMVKIVGAGETPSSTPSDLLFDGSTNHSCLFFEKPAGVDAKSYMLNSGITDEKMYFRFLLDLDNKGHYDFVTGYCEVDLDDPSCYGNKSSIIGYVKVKNVAIKDNGNGPEINPITKAGWNYTRINLPKIANNLANNLPADNQNQTAQGVKNIAKTLANSSMISNVIDLFRGVNGRLKQEKYSRKFKAYKSWIRLSNPDGHKLGGGSRVKSIVMSDEWSGMVSSGAGSTSTYGQEYNYESTETMTKPNGDLVKISSGVATYEPIQSKENPFVQPIFMTTKHLLVPDDEHFIEEPLGESFFPSPTVTYSRVEVKNLVPSGVDNHKSGKVVHEFYTSKDYPTIVDHDLLTPERRATFSKFSLIRGFQKDYMNASQGYVIINNDMNGKQKAQWVYPEGSDQYISGVEYLYNLDATTSNMVSSSDDPFEATSVNHRPGSLNNECMLIHKDGSIKAGTIGIEYDAIADFREHGTENVSQGANAELSTFLLGIVPGVIPSIWPTFSYSHTRFRSAVFTKVINQHGILREVVAHDLGAKVSTKNLAWDAETGEVLLTSVKNEYADEIFTLNYPAHWGYDKMGLSSHNIGVKANINYVSLGKFSSPKASDYFVKGDELLIGNTTKAWVLNVDGTYIDLIDAQGQLITHSSNTTAKVIRSGRRNQQALAIGSVTMKENPIFYINSQSRYKTLKEVFQGSTPEENGVLAASAVEFDDNWQTHIDDSTCVDEEEKYCPNGYSYNTNTGLCEGIDTYEATLNGQLLEVHLGGYKNNTYPLGTKANYYHKKVKFYNNNSTSNPTIVSTASDPNASLYRHKLYNIGVWHYPQANDEWIGFSQCITAPVTKTYCIGIAADNFFRLTVNGNEIINTENDHIDSSRINWFVFPITFQQGNNVVEIEGNNDASYASLAAEIYDATRAEMMSFQNLSNLNATRVFSTIDMLGGYFNLGENDGFSCPHGGYLSYCGGVPQCISPQSTVPEIPTFEHYVNAIVNPFQAAIQGTWRTKQSSLYLGERTQTNQTVYTSTPNASLDLRADGTYATFEPFWKFDNNDQLEKDGNNWTWASRISAYSAHGQEVENQDALYRHSAAIFGYNHSLAVAVANNSRQNQIAYDGFEDYETVAQSLEKKHFGFTCDKTKIVNTESHTGRHSMMVKGVTEGTATTKVTSSNYELVNATLPSVNTACNTVYGDNIPYTIKPCDIVYPFGPSTSFFPEEKEYNDTKVKYVFSYWQKEQTINNEVLDYSNITPYVKINNINVLSTPYSKGKIIDGWQKVEYYFEIPHGTSGNISIEFEDIQSTQSFVDDIRIHPLNSSMKSYVYDPLSLRLWAELDDNNYATFYEYDEEGKLLRIKKETARGIQTIQESRSSSVK